MLAPTSGRVAIDGVPIERLGLKSYRAGIAAVLQDDVLLSGSIADNVSFFDLAPNAQTIERATRLAQIYDDIKGLPMGFDSRIGDMGSALSAGQQQRLLLARALYRVLHPANEPALLFLDEGTSHLDLASELAIMTSIAALGVTCVYTTHRDSVAALADVVLVLGNADWEVRPRSTRAHFSARLALRHLPHQPFLRRRRHQPAVHIEELRVIHAARAATRCWCV